jgi:hypothetical protein
MRVAIACVVCLLLLSSAQALGADKENEHESEEELKAKLKERLIKFYTEVAPASIDKIDALLEKTPDPEKLNKRLKKK